MRHHIITETLGTDLSLGITRLTSADYTVDIRTDCNYFTIYQTPDYLPVGTISRPRHGATGWHACDLNQTIRANCPGPHTAFLAFLRAAEMAERVKGHGASVALAITLGDALMSQNEGEL